MPGWQSKSPCSHLCCSWRRMPCKVLAAGRKTLPVVAILAFGMQRPSVRLPMPCARRVRFCHWFCLVCRRRTLSWRQRQWRCQRSPRYRWMLPCRWSRPACSTSPPSSSWQVCLPCPRRRTKRLFLRQQMVIPWGPSRWRTMHGTFRLTSCPSRQRQRHCPLRIRPLCKHLLKRLILPSSLRRWI